MKQPAYVKAESLQRRIPVSTFFPFLIFFVVALTIRAILNWSYLKQIDKCIKVYGDFFHENILSIDHIIPTLQELSQKAGIPFAEATSPIMAPSLIDPDLYRTIQYQSSCLDQVRLRDPFVMNSVYSTMLQIKSVFQSRFNETFSPIYWIQVIVFAPQKLLLYFDIPATSIISKFFQLIYWILTPITIFYRDTLTSYLLEFLGKL